MDWREMVVFLSAIAAVALVLLSPAACTMQEQVKISEMVRGGTDPIAARCAIESGAGRLAVCVINATERARP